MKNKFYLKEFQFFDGEDTVIFNIVAVDADKITVAVTKCGKISISDYCFRNERTHHDNAKNVFCRLGRRRSPYADLEFFSGNIKNRSYFLSRR